MFLEFPFACISCLAFLLRKQYLPLTITIAICISIIILHIRIDDEGKKKKYLLLGIEYSVGSSLWLIVLYVIIIGPNFGLKEQLIIVLFIILSQGLMYALAYFQLKRRVAIGDDGPKDLSPKQTISSIILCAVIGVIASKIIQQSDDISNIICAIAFVAYLYFIAYHAMECYLSYHNTPTEKQ
jgi:hypothetical protein